MKKLLSIFAAALLAIPAAAQVTVTAPNTVNPAGQPTAVGKTFIINPDGSIATVTGGGGGGSSPSVTNGAAAATTVVPIAGSDGTNARTIRTDAAGNSIVVASGSVAAAQTDSGNPLKIGGYASTSAPTAVTAGQRVNAWYGLNGQGAAMVTDQSGNTVGTVSLNGASQTTGNRGLFTGAFNYLWDGTNYQSQRGDTRGTFTLPADSGGITFTSASAVGNLFSVDTSGYGGVAVHITGTWAGTVTYEASDDNTNWVVSNTTTAIGTAASQSTVGGLFYYNGGHRYFRARVSAYTSGTVTGSAFLRQVAQTPFSSITVGSLPALATGSAFIGSTTLLGTGAGNNPLQTQRLIAAATTNATSVKATGGRLYGGAVTNTTAAFIYLKIYNKASAPTVGTDTPALTIGIAPNSTLTLADIFTSSGYYMSTGIAYAVTGAAVDADTTAVTAGAALINVFYI